MNAIQVRRPAPPGELGIPVLETERLTLRAPSLDDAPAIAALADNRNVAEMTASMPYPYRVEDAEAWILGKTGQTPGVAFAIFEKKSEAFVGICSYEWRGETIPEIGYWAGEPFWGQGYGTEAVRAMIDHAFTATDLEALAATCRVTNVASRRCSRSAASSGRARASAACGRCAPPFRRTASGSSAAPGCRCASGAGRACRRSARS